MAAQEWDWFQREELIGQISDIRVQNLQVERENVQKRTFTRWINLHLEKCDPPLEVKDLFLDIQDGKILMALLEVLSGRNLLHEYKSSSHRIFRLNNIAKALKFLEDSNVKLVSIDAAEIADGNPSLILGLIWNIILFFQIKELTGNLSRNSPFSSLSPSPGGTDSDSSFPPTPTAERSVSAISVKDQRRAIRTLLAWVQRKTRKYGVAVQDFAGSWRSGLAFLAVIKAIDPGLVDMKQALEDSMRENLEKAFSIAQDALRIPRLLEPEDIMVDTPDEQSIVTYVAQFLEHFPELEAEDFVDSERDAPIESTFVRIKETPTEQEGTVFFVTENGERAYTMNHETSHPPPSKVFVCEKPERGKGACLGSVCLPELADSSTEVVHQIMNQVLHGVSGDTSTTSTTSEPSSESSILSRKDNQRSYCLPIKKTVHFEADTYKDASCREDPADRQDFGFEAGSPPRTKDLVKQDGCVVEVAKEKPKPEIPKILAAAPTEPPSDISLVDSRMSQSQTSQSPPSWNGALERAASHREESGSPSPLAAGTAIADSLEVRVQLQTAEPIGEDDFEGIPLKASKFNSDLADFASTSQAFSEDPSPSEKKPAEGEVSEERAEKLGKRRSKSARRGEDADEPPWDPAQEDRDYFLALEDAPVDKKPEVYEKAKRKSPRRPWGEEEEDEEGCLELGRDLPSSPPNSRVSLETLWHRSEEGLDFKPSPPLSKISVIPHDLFYYPHYEVPLAAVLEAYVEGTEGSKNEEMDLGEPEDYLYDLGPEASRSGYSFMVPSEDLSGATIQELDPEEGPEDATPASEPTLPPAQDGHQQGEAVDSAPVESQQSQEPPNPENLAHPLEEKVREESISSKKKEKKKHVDQVESSVLLAAGTVRSSDDLEDEARERRVPSRTSHSDSSVYIRRHANRSSELDPVSYAQLRNAAELEDRRNRTLTRYNTQKLTELILQFYGIRADVKRETKRARMSMKVSPGGRTQWPSPCRTQETRDASKMDKKASLPGEASPREGPSLQSDSLTQLAEQPDMVYFVVFLWLLVYCLLLFPQLDVSRL